MGKPAAKLGDKVIGQDVHIVMVQAGPATVPTPLVHPFSGTLDGNLSRNVNIMGKPAATVDGSAHNLPPHFPTPPGVSFQNPPANKAMLKMGSMTVKINGKPAARVGDMALTCNDPADAPVGKTLAQGTVFIG
jgi:uncharacterized Zn-binding protein involved in type VI secretion